jgi:hypothetical protein
MSDFGDHDPPMPESAMKVIRLMAQQVRDRDAEIVALRAENERLERWKREATEVIASWEIVAEMVTPRTQDLGRSKSDIIADAIVSLRAENEQLQADNVRMANVLAHPIMQSCLGLNPQITSGDLSTNPTNQGAK